MKTTSELIEVDAHVCLNLTNQERTDLAAMLRFYEEETRWVNYASSPNLRGIVDLQRKRTLAKRIIEDLS